MKSADEDKMIITMWAERSLVNRLDVLAEKAGLSRSKLLQNLLKVSVDEMESMDKLGVLATAVVLRDFAVNLRSWREGKKKGGGHSSVANWLCQFGDGAEMWTGTWSRRLPPPATAVRSW